MDCKGKKISKSVESSRGHYKREKKLHPKNDIDFGMDSWSGRVAVDSTSSESEEENSNSFIARNFHNTSSCNDRMLKRKSNATLLNGIEEKLVFKERKASISSQLSSLSSDSISTDSNPPNEKIVLHKFAASSEQFMNKQKQRFTEKKGIFVFASRNSPGAWNPEIIDASILERRKIIRAKEDGARKKNLSKRRRDYWDFSLDKGKQKKIKSNLQDFDTVFKTKSNPFDNYKKKQKRSFGSGKRSGKVQFHRGVKNTKLSNQENGRGKGGLRGRGRGRGKERRWGGGRGRGKGRPGKGRGPNYDRGRERGRGRGRGQGQAKKGRGNFSFGKSCRVSI
eukprot:g1083.t1